MSHTPHDLTEFFPAEALRALRETNPHFVKLSAAYDEVNHAIHRAETNIEPTDDFHMEEMRKKRLALLDEIKGLAATV